MQENELQKHIFDTRPAGVVAYKLQGSGEVEFTFTDGTRLEVTVRAV